MNFGGDHFACAACNCDCGSCQGNDPNHGVCCVDTACNCPCGVCGGGGHGATETLAGVPDHCCACCFPGTGTIYLESGKSVKMSELQIGDFVQTGMKSVKHLNYILQINVNML